MYTMGTKLHSLYSHTGIVGNLRFGVGYGCQERGLPSVWESVRTQKHQSFVKNSDPSGLNRKRCFCVLKFSPDKTHISDQFEVQSDVSAPTFGRFKPRVEGASGPTFGHPHTDTLSVQLTLTRDKDIIIQLLPHFCQLHFTDTISCNTYSMW